MNEAKNSTVRTFLAIQFSDSFIKSLEKYVAPIREACRNFRFLDPKNWHLTLHFFGNLEAKQIDELKTRLSGAFIHIPPFSICIDRLGVFPSIQKSEILWLGIGSEIDKLLLLKEILDQELVAMNFEIESRVFKPHITIARKKHGKQISEQVINNKIESSVCEKVTKLVLFKSILTEKGAIHVPLEEFFFAARP